MVRVRVRVRARVGARVRVWVRVRVTVTVTIRIRDGVMLLVSSLQIRVAAKSKHGGSPECTTHGLPAIPDFTEINPADAGLRRSTRVTPQPTYHIWYRHHYMV